MSDERPRAIIFKAAYADLKVVKTRQVAQLVFEVPLAEADAALEVLGGVPRPDVEVWAGIARIDPKAAHAAPPPQVEALKEHKRFRDCSPTQQAGMRCGEEAFQRFLSEEYGYAVSDADIAADVVRQLCGVKSRSDLATDPGAAEIWSALNSAFEVWMLG